MYSFKESKSHFLYAETEAPGSGHGLAYPDDIRPALRWGQVSKLQGVSGQVPAPLEEEDEASGPEVHEVPDGQGRSGSNLILNHHEPCSGWKTIVNCELCSCLLYLV